MKWIACTLSVILLIALVFGVLHWIDHEISLDPHMLTCRSVSDDVDRLEIRAFAYSKEDQRLIGTVNDPKRIARYRDAYRWTDTMEYCCDEHTRYIIYEYAGDECVGTSRYSYLLSGYNNVSFSAQQLWLILFS